jgi:DNA repair protein RadA/Sms
MARPTSIHVCTDCGHQTPRWHGQCPGCSAWNTMVEERAPTAAPGGRRSGGASARAARPMPLSEVDTSPVPRLLTGIGEFDRVLGGGIVPGSLVLLGGSPGIGKSTLTNMALGNLAGAGRRRSTSRARSRRRRSSCAPSGCPARLSVPVIAETDLDTVLATLEAERPEVVVIDSVQTLHAAELTGAPGSVGQVREVASRIMQVAKAHAIAVLLVGHVTKEGSLAGPRVLEHLVDCVLQFEGERERTYRTLRSLKNRFGSTNEVGVFEMRSGGLGRGARRQRALRRRGDPRARLGRARRDGGHAAAARRGPGARLAVRARPAARVVNGIDRNRLALVLAGPGRHAGRRRRHADVFVNVVGGVRVDEPGADLAVALAVASASRGVTLEARRRSRVRRGRPDRRDPLRRAPGPAHRGVRQVRLGRVLGPSGQRRGIEVRSLRDAVRAALGAPRRVPRRRLISGPAARASAGEGEGS